MKIKFRSAIFLKIRWFNCFINEKISLISQAIKIISISHRKITVALLPASFLFPMSFPQSLPQFLFFFYPTISHYSPRFYHYNYHFRCCPHDSPSRWHSHSCLRSIFSIYILYIFYTSLRIGATTNSRGKRKTP